MKTRNNKLKVALLDRLDRLYDEQINLTFKERPFLEMTYEEKLAHPELVVINEMPEAREEIERKIETTLEKLKSL